MADKIAMVLGTIVAGIVLTGIKVCFWGYLFFVVHHFAVKFW